MDERTTILVIEDEEHIRTVLKYNLKLEYIYHHQDLLRLLYEEYY